MNNEFISHYNKHAYTIDDPVTVDRQCYRSFGMRDVIKLKIRESVSSVMIVKRTRRYGWNHCTKHTIVAKGYSHKLKHKIFYYRRGKFLRFLCIRVYNWITFLSNRTTWFLSRLSASSSSCASCVYGFRFVCRRSTPFGNSIWLPNVLLRWWTSNHKYSSFPSVYQQARVLLNVEINFTCNLYFEIYL
jgi:hypothetical protein